MIPVFFHLLYLLLLVTPYPVTRFAISRHGSLTVEYKKNARSPYGIEDLSIQKETMDKKSAEQEENEGGQEV